MPQEPVTFARGDSKTLPSNKVPGRLLVENDTGNAYVDDTSINSCAINRYKKIK